MYRSFAAAVRNLRHALRALARMPTAAAIIVVSLAAGIGVNTVVFSWIQAVVLHPIAGVDRASDYYLIEPRTSNRLYPGMSCLEHGDLQDRLLVLPITSAAPAKRVCPTGRPARSHAALRAE